MIVHLTSDEVSVLFDLLYWREFPGADREQLLESVKNKVDKARERHPDSVEDICGKIRNLLLEEL
ncbi:hypothetical protein [Tichowtungia aerotolerans]|uniref:Uncharacterized protein n=1 Tax=Tichowtungia aerotolerans TaxID=2697043 RepID=A0A6P1MEM1_9BACT|nr:hypothetical protein [Tichowtungia aerotolerans]QHI69535.1 hypothetical protein GT409_08720 [Tichowtungia aerotolerans]